MIPKIIHYCYLSDEPMPLQFEYCMQSWKAVLTDYEFMLWDKKRFDLSSSLWVQEAYEAKKYASAADYIRLHAVYHYGGLYLDMDVECVRDLSPLLDTDLLLAYENREEDFIEAGVFGACKGHPCIRQCLDWFEGRSYLNTIRELPGYTLPLVWTPLAKSIQPPISVYSWEYFTAKSWLDGKIYKTPNTYCIHHFEGSWLEGFNRTYSQVRYRLCGMFGSRLGMCVSLCWYALANFKYRGFKTTIAEIKQACAKRLHKKIKT